ncbi:MAG TPA: formate/nitrite transporter family protein [Longimicrobiales bacterium]|nr:formate/nitrite transporter family protein [Longimicrobiales bacterium]
MSHRTPVPRPSPASEDREAKTSHEILQEEIAHGLGELNRPTSGLLLSGLSAGLDVGFSLFFMGVMLTLLLPAAPEPLTTLLVANMYSVGFIFVILGRSELFTEHTTLAVFPLLNGDATAGQVGRLWGLVYMSNLVGATLAAVMAVVLGPRLGAIDPEALTTIGGHLVEADTGTMFLSAVVAGWLMGLLSWLASASRETMGRILVVWLITTGMGLAGLHHCIVGTAEVLAAVFVGGGEVTMGDYGRFLLWSTLGNTLGGVTMVAVLKYGHAVQSSDAD